MELPGLGLTPDDNCCPEDDGFYNACCPGEMIPPPTNAPTHACSYVFTNNKDLQGTEVERQLFKDCYTSLRDTEIKDAIAQCHDLCIRRNPSNPLQSNTYTATGATRLKCTVTNCERFKLETIRNTQIPDNDDARLLFCLHPKKAKARNIVRKEECLHLFESVEWADKGVTQEMIDEWNE